MSILDSSAFLPQIPGRIKSSFRDPSGFVFKEGGQIFRAISDTYKPTWEQLKQTSVMTKAVEKKLVLPFTDVSDRFPDYPCTITTPSIPFISYPYEWCFGQLKDAALHTLKLQILCLENGCSLKDASAYNIQFEGVNTQFVDHLSVDIRKDDKPWGAYLQFCKHFYAGLILTSYHGFSILKLFSNWIDGLPLDFASTLLPLRSYLSPSVAIHIHAHAKMQSKHSDARKSSAKVKGLNISRGSLIKLCQSLYSSIEQTRLPQIKTEWGNYYQDTNYTEQGEADKKEVIERIASGNPGNLAVDLGANTGVYSKILSRHYSYVLACDIDVLAVEKHYQSLKNEKVNNILPLVLDLSNPSSAIGWANEERDSFQTRCQADCVSALALIHHLVMTAGIPFALIAEYFAKLLKREGILIIEFVPKNDSQVERLLAAREDIFTDYCKQNFVEAFCQYFDLIDEYPISDSSRTVYVFKKNS